ncbi:hypothetical protein BOTBODRAFT_75847, partial [Botryobasidium botryosum FD-172 SS1]
VLSVNPIAVARSGRPGRPPKIPHPEYLIEAFKKSRNISIAKLAATLHVHRNTLKRYMDMYGIRRDFSQLTNNELDDILRSLRRNNTKPWGEYKTRRPNSLWCLDAHLKLIRWGFAMQGIIDAHCRTLVALRVSTNNTGDTVLMVFEEAISLYGVPDRVRGDRGRKNIKVAVYMIMYRGPNRGS